MACAVAVFAFIGLGSWAVASPVGSSPDDDYHLVSIWCAWGDREGLCAPGSSENERTVPHELMQWPRCYLEDSTQSGDCTISSENVSTDRGDFAQNYPPVYYRVMGLFASDNIEASTLIMRLVNSTIFVGAVVLLFTLLRPGQRGPLLWTIAAGLVPLGIFIVPSTNPSSWAILSGLTVWIALAGYFVATSKIRQFGLGAFAVVVAIMGAGARGDVGIFMVIAAGAASILTFQPTRDWLRRLFVPVIVAIIGIAFFLTTGQSTDYAATTVTQVQATGGGGATETAGPTWAFLLENLTLIPSLWAGSLGTWDIGWFEVELPETISIVMIGAFSALAYMGIRKMDWRKGLTLGLLLLALFAIPSYVLYGLQVLVGTEVQPRYLLPLVLISIGIALYGFERDDLGLTTIQALVLIVGVSVANSLALFKTMRRYITGTDYTGLNLNANVEWWWQIPLSPMAAWAAGSLTFFLALIGAYILIRTRPAEKPLPGGRSDSVKEEVNGPLPFTSSGKGQRPLHG
ncbi:DUF2142 domain-containing protein [Leucobacter sp. CX169]|nr:MULTISPECIES: DUF2142 domain-containing protein [unclassified Leucobacter]